MLTETMEMIQKSVELPNRVTLSYVEQGDPSGVPVLLLHGLTDSWGAPSSSYCRTCPSRFTLLRSQYGVTAIRTGPKRAISRTISLWMWRH
jgi:hypothetical protein